jgi:hypothetical protein
MTTHGRAAGELFGNLVRAFGDVFDDLGGLADRMRGVAEDARAARRQVCRDDLVSLRPAIFDILARHRGLVAGAGIIAAPALLRDAPRWLEWWFTKASGTPEELRVNLDPSAPDFFDYTTADWYATPVRAGQRHVAGPYVDYACTNDYAVTLSLPIQRGKHLLGVAAADVLVSSLERHVLPVLAGFDGTVALANADGRVIASNSPQWAPGSRVSTDAPARGGRRGYHASIESWTLVDVSPARRHSAAESQSHRARPDS